MNPDQIEQMIAYAKEQLVEAFKKEMKSKKLLDGLCYCFPRFDINFKKRKHTYSVEVTYELPINKNEYWEETPRGKQLVSVDPTTGKKSFIIGNSYECRLVYESESLINMPSDIIVLEAVDKDALRAELQVKSAIVESGLSVQSKKELRLNENWENDFRTSS